MNIRPRRKTIASAISLACAAMATLAIPQAQADSAYGVDAVSGNAYKKSYDGGPRDPDATPRKHTPTGQLYDQPPVTEEAAPAAVSGHVEIGILDSEADNPNATFRKYKDPATGVNIQSFGMEYNSENARFLDISGGGVGRGDQFYSLQFGRYNDWKVKGFYNETTHVFTNTYRNLWNGTGTGNLTLKNYPTNGSATLVPVTPPNTGFNATCTAQGAGAAFVTNCYLAPALGITAPATGVVAATVNAANDTAIGNAALATPQSDLSLIRKKGGIRADLNLTDNWKTFASFTNEKREGARPFGMVQGGGGGGGNVDIPESIDYNTIDFLAGVNYADALNSANLTAAVSLFRNNISTLTVENPMFIASGANSAIALANGAAVTSYPRIQYDMYPDTDFYNLKGEYARELPGLMKGRFTGLVSLSQSKQNDSLIPSTLNDIAFINGTIAGGLATGVDGSWDTLDSLSQKSANLKVDMRLIDLGLSFKPLDDLSVKGKVRYYETQTNSNYYACNPLTGQWGRLINGGSASVIVNTPTINTLTLANGGCTAAGLHNVEVLNTDGVADVVPSAGNINIKSMPFAYRQLNTAAGADYQLTNTSSVNVNFDRETLARDHRERAETTEDKIKLGYVNRSIGDGTLRLSFEDNTRRGTPYISGDNYHEFYSTSLGPLPTAIGTNVASWIHVNDTNRKFDLSDRDNNVLNGRFNYMLRSDLDFGASLQVNQNKYPDATYGRNKYDANSLTFDMTWQPSTTTTITGFVAIQDSKMQQRGVSTNSCVIGTTYSFWSDGSVTSPGTNITSAAIDALKTAANGGVLPPVIRRTISGTPGNPDYYLDACGSASANNPLFPTSRTWDSTQKDQHEIFGLGIRFDLKRSTVDMNYTFINSKTAVTYGYDAEAQLLTFNNNAATVATLTAGNNATIGLHGAGFSDLTLEQHILDASVLIPTSKQSAVRLIGRFEFGKIRDWHYDGVAANPAPTAAQQVYLDVGPQDYRAHMFGVSYQHKF